METYTESRKFVDNPHFAARRRTCLDRLDPGTIDGPIVEIVRDLAAIPHCFPMQSCYGHFLFGGRREERGTEPLPESPGEAAGDVDYRIAYLALCVDDGEAGRALHGKLERVPDSDPDFIQFGCAEWFWRRQVNSYVLQVEPFRFRTRDRVTVGYAEALRIQQARDAFFLRLREVVAFELNGASFSVG